MKMKWLWGVVIVASIAGNLVLGAALVGVTMQRHFHPFSIAMKKAKDLPLPERQLVRATFRASAPQLRASLKAAREARIDLAAYVASPNYNHAEAQKRFDDLRAKTTQSQIIAETMFLNMADQIPAEDRSKLLDAQAAK